MNDILKELYLGNLRPYEKDLSQEQSSLLIQLTNQEEELMRGLTYSQQEKLREYLEVAEKMHCDTETESFIDGFKLGIRLILAAVAE